MKRIINKILSESQNNLNSNFHKWFGDSKVVYNGKPFIVYHGSQEGFEEFYKYSYFTDDWYNADGYAGGEYVYEVYLSLKNPLIVDGGAKKWDEMETEYGSSTQDIVGYASNKGYDGVIINNVKDSWIDDVEYQDAGTVYVNFKPNQVKSTDNDGSWDTNDNNIYS